MTKYIEKSKNMNNHVLQFAKAKHKNLNDLGTHGKAKKAVKAVVVLQVEKSNEMDGKSAKFDGRTKQLYHDGKRFDSRYRGRGS